MRNLCARPVTKYYIQWGKTEFQHFSINFQCRSGQILSYPTVLSLTKTKNKQNSATQWKTLAKWKWKINEHNLNCVIIVEKSALIQSVGKYVDSTFYFKICVWKEKSQLLINRQCQININNYHHTLNCTSSEHF